MVKSNYIKILITLIGVFILQIIASTYSYRFDLTSDKRYSLSLDSKTFLLNVKEPIRVDVFLNGKLPQEYQRLRTEIDVLLQSIVNQNGHFYYEFIDPFEGRPDTNQLLEEMSQYGLYPELIVENENQVVSQSYVFPWMIINKGNRSVRVSLLQKNLGDTPEQRIIRSIQQLEYVTMDGVHQLFLENKKKIAFLSSHKTSKDILVTSALQSLSPYYNLASFDLKAFPETPKKTLENLNNFDLLLVSNPKEIFSNTEKFILDQYTQQGGNSIYFIDPVAIRKDSLFNLSGTAVSYGNRLELDDLFFKFGFRVRQELVQDVYNAPIVLAQGSQNNTQYLPYPWAYHPLVPPRQNNLIGAAVNNVLLQFASPIDTLKNKVYKQILLESSPFTKIKGIPSLIELSSATKPIDPNTFSDSQKILGVLLEGEFPSLFNNRIQPFEWEKPPRTNARIAVFGDGNLIENQTDKGKPLELGYDKWTNNYYSNKQFIKNTIHYLMGDTELLKLRSKEIKIAMLDTTKVNLRGLFWRYFSLLSPLLLFLCIGLALNYLRHKNYR